MPKTRGAAALTTSRLLSSIINPYTYLLLISVRLSYQPIVADVMGL